MHHLVQQAPRSHEPVDGRSTVQAARTAPRAGDVLNAGTGVASLMQLHGLLNQRPAVVAKMQLAQDLSRRGRPVAPVQRANLTGLPDRLKAGAESLSGLSLDDVRVHYNSAEPATLQAAAYARGSDIHVGPGQERHLPHEAWHVVQQKQGRVAPTMQAKGVAINGDRGLESEADRMGAQALRMPDHAAADAPLQARAGVAAVQRVIGPRPEGEFKSNLQWGQWFSAMSEAEVGEEAMKLGLMRAALDNMNVVLERNGEDLIAIPLDYVGPRNRAMPERDRKEKGGEPDVPSFGISMVERRTLPVEVLSGAPKLQQDGPPRILSDKDMREILRQAIFRHGRTEAEQINAAFNKAAKDGPVSLPALLDKLRDGTKAERRTAHLLQLTVNDLASGDETPALESWDMFSRVARFIMTHAGSFNRERQDNALGELYILLDADRRTWHAAAVAALRNGALDETGFEYLADLLFTLTGLSILNERAPDVKHELALQSMRYNPGTRTGSAVHPAYEHLGGGSTAEKTSALNSKSSSFDKLVQSGAYKQDGSLITKTLDIGHTAVDKFENIAHRSENTVAPDTRFDYLALLSPNGEQQAVGTNGAVLGDGSYMFVVDRQFRLRYMPAANYVGEGETAKNFVQFIPHSQLAGRADVLGAGNFFIRNGHFVWIDNGSGHYRVDAGLNEANVTVSLRALGYDVRDIDFLSRGAGDLDSIYREGNEILDKFDSGRPDVTEEISAMEFAMRTLIPHDEKSFKPKRKAIHPPETGVEMTTFPIKMRRQVRVPKGVVIDPVFGQNEKLTEHIGDDRL